MPTIESLSKTAQLKSIIMGDIVSGRYPPGSLLPSIRELSASYGVCKHTVSQTLSVLSEMGVVSVAHGKRAVVVGRLDKKEIVIFFVSEGRLSPGDFWHEVYGGIMEVLEKSGEFEVSVKPLPPGDSLGGSDAGFSPQKTAGILLVGSSNPFKINCLAGTGAPLVVAYHKSPISSVPYVAPDLELPIRRITESFAASRRRRLVYVGPLGEDKGIDGEKARLFIKCAREAGFGADEISVLESGYGPEDGYESMLRLLSRGGGRPDAAFMASDQLCVGAYKALFERGLRIPEDMAVAGCDNLPGSSFMTPPLTSIDVRRREIGRLAASLLLKRMGGLHSKSKAMVKAELVLRDSM